MIVYLRSIPPVHRAVPKTELIFPVKYLIRSAPQPYLRTVPAVNHHVDNSKPPTLCKICGLMHGVGDQNEANRKEAQK